MSEAAPQENPPPVQISSPPPGPPSSYIPFEEGSKRNRVKKRIIVCCDGYCFQKSYALIPSPFTSFPLSRTWQDGLRQASAWMYTNVLVRNPSAMLVSPLSHNLEDSTRRQPSGRTLVSQYLVHYV
jgi:hypothetical protein